MTGSDKQMPHVLLHMWEVVFNLCTSVYDMWCGVCDVWHVCACMCGMCVGCGMWHVCMWMVYVVCVCVMSVRVMCGMCICMVYVVCVVCLCVWCRYLVVVVLVVVVVVCGCVEHTGIERPVWGKGKSRGRRRGNKRRRYWNIYVMKAGWVTIWEGEGDQKEGDRKEQT